MHTKPPQINATFILVTVTHVEEFPWTGRIFGSKANIPAFVGLIVGPWKISLQVQQHIGIQPGDLDLTV